MTTKKSDSILRESNYNIKPILRCSALLGKLVFWLSDSDRSLS